jgi:hypothetical protein
LGSVRILYPKPKLGQLLRASGPISKSKSEGQGAAELARNCERQLIALVIQVEQAVGRLSAVPDEQALARLYGLLAGGVGAGAVLERQGVDTALLKLCSLISRFRAHGTYDAEAMTAHVKALRVLVVGRDLSDADVDQQLVCLTGKR